MARVYWIRHGQSEANANSEMKAISVPAYIGLSAKGIEQAEAVKKALIDIGKPDLIVLSGFLRALKTAEPTIDYFFPKEKYIRHLSKPPEALQQSAPEGVVKTWHLTEEFTYLNPGDFVGSTLEQRDSAKRDFFTGFDPELVDGLFGWLDDEETKWPNDEKKGGTHAFSFSQLIFRARRTLEELGKLPENHVVFMFGHEQFMQVIRLLEAFPKATDGELMRMFYEVSIKLPEHVPTSPIENGQIIKSVVNDKGITIERKDLITAEHLKNLPPDILKEIVGREQGKSPF